MRLTVMKDDFTFPVEIGEADTVSGFLYEIARPPRAGDVDFDWLERFTPTIPDPISQVDNFRAIVSAELGIHRDAITLWCDGQELTDGNRLSDTSAKSDSLVYVRRPDAGGNGQAPMSSGGSSGAAFGGAGSFMEQVPGFYPGEASRRAALGQFQGLKWSDITNEIDPAILFNVLKQNPAMVEAARSNPELYEACTSPTVLKLRRYLIKLALERSKKEIEAAAARDRLRRNPHDKDAQAILDEQQRESDVKKNWELAMEHSPESFARVVMLYIPVEVNGHKMNAFVDSGAQQTIMGKKYAEECGLIRLMDTRYAGQAVGVGSAPILGRVHLAPMKVGNTFFNCTFTIIDQDSMDLLFGLDMLRRHQACIDLEKGVLRLMGANGKEEVRFLSEGEIKKGSFGTDGFADGTKDTEAEAGGDSSKAAAASGGAGAGAAGSTPMDDDGDDDGGGAASGVGYAGAGAGSGYPALGGATAEETAAADAAVDGLLADLGLGDDNGPDSSKESGPSAGATTASSSSAAATAPQSAESGAEWESKLARISGMGFPRTVAEGALRAASGDAGLAVQLLLGQYQKMY